MLHEQLFKAIATTYDPSEIIEALNVGVILLDSNFSVIYTNITAQSLLSASLEKLQGYPLADLFADSECLNLLLERALRKDEPLTERELSLRLANAPSEEKLLDININIIDSSNGDKRLLLELIDAAPRMRYIREDELRARLEGSRMMTRQLAHEIKNPLGGLRGAAQLLERQLPNNELREYTAVIINEADRLTALVDSMLGFAHPPKKAIINVHEICEYVYQLLHAEASTDTKITRDYDPSVPEALFDRNQLVQAILNLARNALQAVDQTGHIILRTRVVVNGNLGNKRHRLIVKIDVQDDGPGVPASIKDTLFLPLVTARTEGTGLGLAVSQEIVVRNGGVIEYQSEVGRTVFSVLLPLVL